MGTLYKRGRKYYVNALADGRRIRKSVGSSKRVAELALKDLELKIERKEYGFDVPDSPIESLFEEYLEYSRTNHEPASQRRYRNVIHNFRVFLALKFPRVKSVSQLKMSVFEKYKAYRKAVDPRTIDLPFSFPYTVAPNALKASARTLNYEIKTLRSIFNFGIKNKLCRDNPCKGVPLLKVKSSERRRYLTEEEISRLLENAGPELHPIFYTFLHTGLRRAELVNLQWSDIDFKRKKLAVSKKDFWIPKAGERDIPLSDRMILLLKNHRRSGSRSHHFVFGKKDGSKLGKNLRKLLIAVAKQAGLEDFTRIHDLRHTFASHLVMKGVDIPTVQKLLGHSDIQTTMIYAHLAPDHLAGAVDKLTFE